MSLMKTINTFGILYKFAKYFRLHYSNSLNSLPFMKNNEIELDQGWQINFILATNSDQLLVN